MSTDANDKSIFGWCFYDWANSAFILTVVTAVLPVYFASVVVPESGFSWNGTVYSATTLWGLAIGGSGFFVFIAAPVLGAIADFTAAKKKFLMVFCYSGSLFTLLLFFCGSGDVLMTIGFLVLAQIGFVGGNIFYDAFLPHVAPPEKMDWVSGKGFAYGYIGSDIQFLMSLGLILGHEALGLSSGMAVRIVLVFSGLWWAGFSLITWRYLHEAPGSNVLPESLRAKPKVIAYLRVGLSRTWVTLRAIANNRHLFIFLVGFMLYNEGIQTVITMATIYGKEELKLSTPILMVTLFMIQLVAMVGSLAFGKMAGRIGTKRAIMITLVGWSGVVVYAYVMHSAVEYMILGGIVGIVMGGSQALSRSYYGSMIPKSESAEYYAFYSVFTKFSAIWGPITFAVIRQVSGSARLSILSVIVFFIAGLTLLTFVNESKAKHHHLNPQTP